MYSPAISLASRFQARSQRNNHMELVTPASTSCSPMRRDPAPRSISTTIGSGNGSAGGPPLQATQHARIAAVSKLGLNRAKVALQYQNRGHPIRGPALSFVRADDLRRVPACQTLVPHADLDCGVLRQASGEASREVG